MAKMFYTIDEAAEKLGVSEDQIKEMVGEGKLQQFRDRDKLMFKRDEVDSIAGASESGEFIPLVDSGETDAIDLSADDSVAELEDPRSATGVSVFDASEVDLADPMAQTSVTVDDDEEIALETVGSGSGLLDLTRESDDTSLGAELLDDIMPGDGTDAGSSAMGLSGTGLSASGIFDSGVAMETPEGTSLGTGMGTGTGMGETGTSFGGGFDDLDGGDTLAGDSAAAVSAAPMAFDDDSDPAGSGLGAGLLIGATAALIILMAVMFNAIAGVSGGILSTILGDVSDPNGTGVYIWAGGLLVGSIVLGVIGMMIGKAAAR